MLQAFETTPFEFVFSVPPRHGKTELILHFIVWALKRNPSLNIAYLTYSAAQAQVKARRALVIAKAAGLELVKQTLSEWGTPKNELVLFTGINGAVTGKGFDIIIIDDPVKNRVEAESPTYRERHWDTMQSDLMTRLEPGGSICIIQTRWHEDDLAGRLTKGNLDDDIDPWATINMPAIDTVDGEEVALWPERWPLELLHRRRRRVGPYAWASLYQGRPTPRGSSVFQDPTFFSKEPNTFRAGHGLDLAYSSKTSADFSVIVTLLREQLAKAAPRYYVVRVRRRQCKAPEFKVEVRQALAQFKGPIRFYATGPEEGVVDFIRDPPNPINIDVLRPNGDKFTRSIPFAAGWNAGDVLIPSPELVSEQPGRYGWVNEFLDELKVFTGVKDAHDDQVDASAAGYDALAGPPATYESLADLGIKAPTRGF